MLTRKVVLDSAHVDVRQAQVIEEVRRFGLLNGWAELIAEGSGWAEVNTDILGGCRHVDLRQVDFRLSGGEVHHEVLNRAGYNVVDLEQKIHGVSFSCDVRGRQCGDYAVTVVKNVTGGGRACPLLGEIFLSDCGASDVLYWGRIVTLFWGFYA